MAKPNPIPEGRRTLTPHLTVAGARRAIDYYKEVFGAEELGCHLAPGSDKVMHAEIRIGDSVVMLTDEFPGGGATSPSTLGGTPVTLHMYVPDCDATYRRAIAAGAKEVMAPWDTFWGDRYGILTDPFGHSWSIATHQRDVPREEVDRRAAKYFESQA